MRDTGPGMTPHELKTALEPFGQVDAGHTRRYEGTGLGLPLAQRLTELHGGLLTVDSIKGVGTTVTVILPPERTVETAAIPPRTIRIRSGQTQSATSSSARRGGRSCSAPRSP